MHIALAITVKTYGQENQLHSNKANTNIFVFMNQWIV
jgi:hypothetical protein